MRDPKRIKGYCNKLASEWEKVPDWRFGQLLSNVIGAFYHEKKSDIFFCEDEEMFEFIERYFNNEISPTVNEQ